jgi:hypothetical protein
MKAKRYVSTVLLVSLFLSLAFVNSTSAQIKPTIRLEPTNYTGKVGSTFYADIYIYDANIDEGSEVYSWQICLFWDPAVLDVDNVVIWGDFMDTPRIGPWGTMTAEPIYENKTVDVADGSKFWYPSSWGKKVLIQDAFHSEFNNVSEALGNRLTLESDLVYTYSVAAGAAVYPWPTTLPSTDIPTSRNRIICGRSGQGPPPGVSGNGLLATLKFYVLSQATTTLDLDHSVLGKYTYIMNSIGESLGDDPSGTGDPGYYQSELLKEGGNFILPWVEDINADGAVDIFDLSSVALWWGETVPPAPPEVDLDNNDVINVVDLTLVSVKYGTYANA